MIKRQINRSFIFVDSYFGMNNNFRNILSVKKGFSFLKFLKRNFKIRNKPTFISGEILILLLGYQWVFVSPSWKYADANCQVKSGY